jgi:hypothetical protein
MQLTVVQALKAGRLELLDRRSSVTREEDDIPAVVTHGGRPIATVPTVRVSNYGSCGERMQWSERRRAFVCCVCAREKERGRKGPALPSVWTWGKHNHSLA